MRQVLSFALLVFLAYGCKTANFKGNTATKNTPPPSSINSNPSNALENPIIPTNGTTTTETKPDGTVVTTTRNPDGTTAVTTKEPDGTITTEVTKPNGEVTTVINDPDGTSMKEIKNPDGTKTTTTVIVHPDGGKTTETKYPDGSKTVEEAKPQGPTVVTTTKPDGTITTTTVIRHPDGTSTTDATVTPPGGKPTTESTSTKPDGTVSTVVTAPDGKTTTTVQKPNPDGTTTTIVTTPDGKSTTETSTMPVAPGKNVAPTDGKGGKTATPVFVDCPENPNYMLKAELYEIPPTSDKVPNFQMLKKKKDICLRQLDVFNREFTEGFPGILNLVEWFALDIRWRVEIPEDGDYTFYLNSDDGSFLYIDNQLVINNDGLHPHVEKQKSIKLSKGWHSFQVTWFQGPRYNIALELFWKRPNAHKREYIPVQYFARPAR